MAANLIEMKSYRKRKSTQRVFEALEQFQRDILLPVEMEEEGHGLTPDELEEFMLQVLGDHLLGRLESTHQVQSLDEYYRQFDGRLRRCLQTKLKSLARFENLK